jgi:N-acetylglutamate synthase-like GNAT family acetyltransferase
MVIPYEKKYQQGIVDLILPIQQQEFGVPITINDQPDLQNIASFYMKGNGNFWVAVDEEKVVGTIALVDIGNSQVALRKMFVHKDYRGKQKGAAQALIDTLFEWARNKQLQAVFLGTIDTMLAAHRFYRKNGFVEIAKEQLPPAFPLMAVDNRFFKWEPVAS